MAAIYEDFVFSEDQLSAALSQAPELPGTEARALLYQSLRRQQLPVARAEVMRSYFELAASAQRYQMAVEVLLPELSAMPVRSDMAWFAETAARAFYSIGRYEQAGSWLAVLQRAAAGDEEARRRRKDALDHPAVNAALEILEGEILEIRPLGEPG